MTTVDEVVQRTIRDWLVPPDNQPMRVILAEDVDPEDTSFTYDPSTISPEEEDLIGPGVIIEVNYEQMLLTDTNIGNGTVTVQRGTNGTEATAHDEGDHILLSPTFGRQTVYDAVRDTVAGLRPHLYAVRNEAMTVEEHFNEAPEDMVLPVNFSYMNELGQPQRAGVTFNNKFPDSSTGKIVQIHTNPGRSGFLNYRGHIHTPESPDDTMEELGVEQHWLDLLMVGATLRIIGARDIEAASQEYLTRQLEQQGFPVQSAGRIRERLVQFYEYLLSRDRADLYSTNPTIVTQGFPRDGSKFY